MTPKGSRNRAKPSPSGADSPPPATRSNATGERSSFQPDGRTVSQISQVTLLCTLLKEAIFLQNWYPGPWSAAPRASKAAPVTEVAHESISVAQSVASGLAEISNSILDNHKRSQHESIRLTKKAGASTRSLPAGVTTTCVNIASDGSASTTALASNEGAPDTKISKHNRAACPEEGTHSVEKSTEHQELSPDINSDLNTSHLPHTALAEQSSGWFSWLYNPSHGGKDKMVGSADPEPIILETTRDKSQSNGSTAASQATTQNSTTLEIHHQARKGETSHDKDKNKGNTEITESKSMTHKRSWLQIWYSSASPTKHGEQATEPAKSSVVDPVESATSDVGIPPNDTFERPESISGLSPTPNETTKSSGWSFWARDVGSAKPQDTKSATASIDSTNTPTRSKTLESDSDTKGNITKNQNIKAKKLKDNCSRHGAMSPVETISTSSPSAELRPLDAVASKQLQSVLPNQILPRFEDTYSFEESPTLLQSLSRLLHSSKIPEHNHVSRVKDPPRLKRALAIGVHGYFPAPLIRSVLGQPTGTSIRFSNMAAETIRKWTANHGYSCEVEKIALEGEGRISDRVDLLWKLLLNWMEEIREADFILIACHSQGVPVSIMLVARLISFGCVNASRVGICAMAGVNMGPFSSYRSRWISGSAGELFEFELPFSKVSKDYETALKHALDFGVRISYVGSIDDQLVSLEVC